MSDSGTLGRWLFGCAVVFIVCLLICGGAVALFLPKIGRQVAQVMEEIEGIAENEAQQAQIDADWNAPPEDAGVDRLFPPQVADYELADAGEVGGVEEYDIEAAGFAGTYRQGDVSIEVAVFRAAPLEVEALLTRVEAAIEENFASKSQFSMNYGDRGSYVFSGNPPETAGMLWWNKGWLVFVRSESQPVVEQFLDAYINAIGGETEAVDEPAVDLEEEPVSEDAAEDIPAEPPAVPNAVM